jgi:hypothetical protein
MTTRLFQFASADDATGTLLGGVNRYSDGRQLPRRSTGAMGSPPWFTAPIRTTRLAVRQRRFRRRCGPLAQRRPPQMKTTSSTGSTPMAMWSDAAHSSPPDGAIWSR